ncbi:hypothetical protein C8R47DRAFT_1227106 [Mycena vitilis]|nr:hypothetical protein C8R47DRAFT_1227106 [Mycena vitilis]
MIQTFPCMNLTTFGRMPCLSTTQVAGFTHISHLKVKFRVRDAPFRMIGRPWFIAQRGRPFDGLLTHRLLLSWCPPRAPRAVAQYKVVSTPLLLNGCPTSGKVAPAPLTATIRNGTVGRMATSLACSRSKRLRLAIICEFTGPPNHSAVDLVVARPRRTPGPRAKSLGENAKESLRARIRHATFSFGLRLGRLGSGSNSRNHVAVDMPSLTSDVALFPFFIRSSTVSTMRTAASTRTCVPAFVSICRARKKRRSRSWLDHAPGERSIDELMEAAKKSLKGCAQHFREQITRVKKISGVVDPAKADIFENHARKLLTSKSMDEFTDRANKFIQDFPRAEPWIRWWMLPAHAIMLFPAFRVMNPELWDSIPDTTNAEEAMHWKLYAAIGRFLSLMDGMKRLYKFAEHYQRLFDAAGHGVKIFYGRDRQSWKRAAEKFGTTKYSRRRAAIRAAKHANDGRPPDTGKALLGRGAKKQKHEYEKSYAWKENSCWLDSSLTLLSAAAARDDASIDAMFAELPASHPLRDLRQMLHTRLNSVNLTEYEDGGSSLLNNQRDGFRRTLCAVPHSPIKTTTGLETMFGWLYHISGKRVTNTRESRPSVERAQSYFAMSRILFKTCVGSSNEHYQLSPVQLRNIVQLHSDLCRRYDGDLRKWFQEYVRVSKPEPLEKCWHTRDGVPLCDGSANAFEVVLNIPIVLIIELGDVRSSAWNIPSSLSPYANNPSASSSGVKYTIVGHIYCSQTAQHFIARYLTPSGKKIFDYDGMRHEGHAIRSKVTAVRGSLTGPSRSMVGVPSGYFLYAVMYHLVGGEPAQRFFRKQQINDAAKLGLQLDIDPSSKTGIPSAVDLVRPGVQRIADDDRFWLLAPLADKNTDYILPESEPSPRKKRASTSPQKPRAKPAIVNSIGSDSDDIDDLLLETLDSPVIQSPKKSSRARKTAKPRTSNPTSKAADTSIPYTDSTTPCPVFCEGYGMQDSDGDDDPEEVQCGECRLWAHIACLASNIDWADPEVKFICKRCSEDPLVDLWHEQQVVLIPSPLVPSWKAPDVLWYPARFIERHRKRAGKKDEYEFRWLQCNDGTIYNSATSELPLMIQRTFHRSRKFCQAIYEVHLDENQVGVIRLPRYMDPTFERHENPALAAIFDAAEPRIAKILARFSSNHPVVANFETYFGGKKTIARSRDAEKWLRHCQLITNPELDAVLEPGLGGLMNHPGLKHIPLPERSERVPGVGSVLLQLLAIQHELDEPLNLNGDLLGDLLDDRVVHCPNDGEEGLEAMFAVTAGASQVAGRMLRFRAQHAIYDDEYRPPTYHRLERSRLPATDAIRVIFKRKADDDVEAQRPAKRTVGGKGEVTKSDGARKVRLKTPPKRTSGRKLRSNTTI